MLSIVSQHAFSQDTYRDVGIPISQVFTANEHKSGSQIWWLDVDEQNRIFAGTSNGLAVYDGEQWTVHKTPNETLVRSISFKNNRIYAGTNNDVGYFENNDAGTYSWISLTHLFEQGADSIGEVYSAATTDKIVAYSGLYNLLVYDGQSIKSVDDVMVAPGAFRLFSVDNEILFMSHRHTHVYSLTNDNVAQKKTWKVPQNVRVNQIFKTQKGQLLMQTQRNGLFVLAGNEFLQVLSPNQLPDDTMLYNAMQSSDGYFYMTSILNGIFVLDEDFNLLRNYNEEDNLGMQTVLAVAEDKQGNIWISGEPNITVFTPPHLRSQQIFESGSFNSINSVKIGVDIFALGNGIYHFDGSSDRPLNANTSQFKQIVGIREKVWDMEKLGDDYLIAAETGVFAITKNESGFSLPRKIAEAVNVQDLSISSSRDIAYGGDDRTVFSIERLANGSWQKTDILDVQNQFENIVLEPNGAHREDDVIWASATDSSLYRISGLNDNGRAEDLIRYYGSEHNLGNDNIKPFFIYGQIHFGTSKGVFRYDTSLEKSPFYLFKDLPPTLSTDGLDVFLLSSFEQNSLLYQAGGIAGIANFTSSSWQVHEQGFAPYGKTGIHSLFIHNDAIWMGVVGGSIIRFSIAAIKNIPPEAPLSITRIININDASVLTNFSEKMPLDVISREQNSIRIEYALADHSSTSATQYRSRISGQDLQNWSVWSTEAQKDFPLLAGGDYTFEVEAKDPWKRTLSTKVSFEVLPPWYLSTNAIVAYIISGLFLLVLSGWVTQKWRTKSLQRQNLLLENMVSQRTAEVETAMETLKQQQILKDKFFTNISHEFRTPLTLTIGPLKSLLDEHADTLQSQTKDLANTALNNAKMMLSLIGQVLDINRLEAGKLQLRVTEFDIAMLVRKVLENFQSWSKQQDQELSSVNCSDPLLIYADIDNIESCITNLLSNAIKYSGAGSKIVAELVTRDDYIEILIKDSGKGIPVDEQLQVFERFYQASNKGEVESKQGTGIGLALVKDIIELHGGSINLRSQEGHGCTFNMSLLRGKSHFSDDMLVEPLALAEMKSTKTYTTEEFVDEQDKVTILVIDDNTELRRFIVRQLSNNYRIVEAENGKLGLASALEHFPDLIISDVSMPVMDGIEVAKQLKMSPVTAGIPLILLTAKATKREIVEGFDAGADDYLTKPFDTSELIARVNSQLLSRKNIGDSIEFEHTKKLLPNMRENEFSAKLIEAVEKYLHDPSFSVEHLAKEMAMTNKTLSRKCKDTFKDSPRSLIINLRMHHAANLLNKGGLSISDVAYATGFESLAYFSKSFKKHTGQNPSDFIKKNKSVH